MKQKDLAKLLGISPAMVSRLAKRSMPTDSLERAERWRRRHLEPARVKGARFDPMQAITPITPKSAPVAIAVFTPSVDDVEEAGVELDNTLRKNDPAWAQVMVQNFRDLLRQLPDDAEPRLSLRVWLAMVDWIIPPGLAVCHAPDKDELLNPVQFGLRWHHPNPAFPLLGHHTLSHACDWGDISLNGWPQYPDDDEPGQVMP